jgi:hypothetical protein
MESLTLGLPAPTLRNDSLPLCCAPICLVYWWASQPRPRKRIVQVHRVVKM